MPKVLLQYKLAEGCTKGELADAMRVAMLDGKPFRTGAPQAVLTEDMVRQVFGLESRILTDPTSDRPMMLPIAP